VNERQAETRYLRPETAHGGDNDVWHDLLWCVGGFAIRGVRYEVLHASHPDNPADGETVYSTRAYGRFGAFSEFDLEPGREYRLRYRIVVTQSEESDDETPAWTLDGPAEWQAFVSCEARQLD
jgi:hypothetical protein